MSWRVWESRICFNEAQVKASKNIANRETVFKFLGRNETVWRNKDSRVRSLSPWCSMPGRQLSAQMELLVSKMLWVLFWFCLLPISQSPFLLPLFLLSFFPIFPHVLRDTQTGAYCKGTMIEPNRPRPSAISIVKFYICIYFRIKPTNYSKCLIICNLFSYLKLVLFSIHIPVTYMSD